MGYRSTSTRRTSAASAVSSQSVVVNTPTGFSAVGATIKSNTSISLGVTTAGQTSAATTTTVSAGPSITTIQYLDANNQVLDDDIAISTAGGNVLINGTGFVTGSNVYVNNSLVSNTFVSSTQIIATLPSASAGNVNLMIFSPTNTGTLKENAIRYSGAPSWSTAAASFFDGTAANVTLAVSGDSTLTYTLQAGSSLPTGISLDSAGYLSGTPTGYTQSTTNTVVIIATDLEGQATQQTITWTVQVAEMYFKNTMLLLNGDAGSNIVNSATNNTFQDSSSNNFTVTRVGKATQGSFTPFSQTGWSSYFNGNGDYQTLTIPAIGTSDFTIECWVYLPSYKAGTYNGIFDMSGAGYAGNLGVGIGTSGTDIRWILGGSTTSAGANTFQLNKWTHIALVKSSGTLRLYVDGIQKLSAANTSNYTLTAFNVGRWAYWTTSYQCNMYISNLRIVAGTGLYTTNPFDVPTTALTAVSGTQLLMYQDNRFVDKSTNAAAITTYGSPSVQAFSPLSPGASYSTSTHGGSTYLDGSGNYLSVANNAALNITSGSTDSYICDFWVYFTLVGTNMSIVDNGGLNSVSFANWSVTLNASSQITLNWGNSAAPGSTIGILATSIVPTVGQWYHIAFVKTNADWALFVNGTRATNYSGLNTAAKSSSTAFYIGYGIATSASGTPFKGYISNVRVYKGASGSAPYAATSTSITVPTAPTTAITNTQLLCNFVNGGVVDAHSTALVETTSGVSLNTSVVKYGTASIYFNGSSYLNTLQVGSPNFDLVTGDFTVEAWIYNTGAGAERYLFSQRGSSSGWEWRINSTNVLQFFFTGGSSLSTTGTISANTWTHIAVTRSGSTVRIFINGTQDAITSFSDGTTAAASYPLYIGYSTSGGGYFLGYMDDIRITRGYARYTANFTAPTTGLLGQ